QRAPEREPQRGDRGVGRERRPCAPPRRPPEEAGERDSEEGGADAGEHEHRDRRARGPGASCVRHDRGPKPCDRRIACPSAPRTNSTKVRAASAACDPLSGAIGYSAGTLSSSGIGTWATSSPASITLVT